MCGYSDFEAFDHTGLTTFEICPCCGMQSGHSYGETANADWFGSLRKVWLSEGGGWHSKSEQKPSGWNYKEQLSKAGISV